MAGDGCLSYKYQGNGSGGKYWIYICGHKEDDLDYFTNYIKPLFKKLFNKEVKVEFRKDCNALFIRFSDKQLFGFLNDLGLPIGVKYSELNVPKWIDDNELNARGFLRGLFDTDGTFILSKQHKGVRYYPRLEITSHSEKFTQQVFSLLKKLKFYGSISKKNDSFRIELPGKLNLYNWVNSVNSSNAKHRNKIYKYLSIETSKPR